MSSDSFFSKYPEFDHDPTASLVGEFQRLSLQRGWKPGGKKYRQTRQRCFTQEFEHHYGHASDKLAGWQALCADVYISPTPSSITQCKKAGRPSHHLSRREVADSLPQYLGALESCCQPCRPCRFSPHGAKGETFPFESCASKLFYTARKDLPEETGQGEWVSFCAFD